MTRSLREPPALSPPAKRQTLKELQKLQRLAASMVMRPLGPGMRTQTKWTDNRPTAAVAATFIKPNDRLTSFERVEIYNRQYWFRLIDCLYEDYPGLLAVLGQNRFDSLIHEYLEKYPSRSFTLRNLGSALPRFLEERPDLAGARHRMALDMARFEWAQVVAFDGPALPPITANDLQGANPAKLRFRLQPYITVLEMHYPLDDFSQALKKQSTALRSEASNAIDQRETPAPEIRKFPLPRKQTVHVAVHRHDNDLYYKRLEPQAYRILIALEAGKPLAQACAAADSADLVKNWFENWTALGWFCKRSRSNP